MFLKQSLRVAFYEELHKAVEGYISDKLMLPMADLSRENIKDQLVGKGASLSLVQELFDLLDACEFARYAPSADSSSMEKDLNLSVAKKLKECAKEAGYTVIMTREGEETIAEGDMPAGTLKKEDMHKMAEANKAFAHYRY